jgi:hypothetical protein
VNDQKGFVEQHPVLLGLGIVLGVGFIGVYWQVFLVIAAALGAATVVWWICREAQRANQAVWSRRRELATRRLGTPLWTRGDPQGAYGRYPPAP